MKQIVERLKAAWCVLTHREYIVFTTTTYYSKNKINNISCFVGDNNTKLFNESAEMFLTDKVNKND